jgi:carboxynorspermidine decarboxylase
MFNGVAHPSIALLSAQNELIIYRRFGYEDYRDRMA